MKWQRQHNAHERRLYSAWKLLENRRKVIEQYPAATPEQLDRILKRRGL